MFAPTSALLLSLSLRMRHSSKQGSWQGSAGATATGQDEQGL